MEDFSSSERGYKHDEYWKVNWSCYFCIKLFVQVAVEEGEKNCSSLEQGVFKRFQRSEPGRCRKINLRGEKLSEE